MISIIVKNKVKKEHQQEFIEYATQHISASLKEDKGCKFFSMSQPQGDEIVFIELWETQEDIDAHNKNTANRPHISKINTLRYDRELFIYHLI